MDHEIRILYKSRSSPLQPPPVEERGAPMEDMEKMRVRLEHWIEHNASHRVEFEKWAARLNEAGQPGVSGYMKAAAQRLEDAESCLQNALKELSSKA
jgi:regulator of replication initiation timing